MYLSRLRLNQSRRAVLWTSNPYRVHQRLMMACDGDPRLLFRIEESPDGLQILVQSQVQPAWTAAFNDFPVLLDAPESKPFDPTLQTGRLYRFRLLANPTVKRTFDLNGGKHKKRLGLLKEADQIAWLKRKLEAAGAEVQDCLIIPQGFQRSRKSAAQEGGSQTHLAVLFEGLLTVKDPQRLSSALASGIGAAKGFGFGLLSLAPRP